MVRLILSLCLIISLNSFAQEDSRALIGHQFGVKGGLNYSSMGFKPGVSQELKPGIYLGGVYNYQAQKAAGVQIEFMYIQYGWVETFSDQSMYYNRDINYLEMPILSNFVLGKRKTHGKFQLGPKLSYVLSDQENTNITDAGRVYYGWEIKDKMEVGVAIGASISRAFTFGELQLDTRFNISLSNVFDPTDDFELEGAKNRSLSVGLTYWFDAK